MKWYWWLIIAIIIISIIYFIKNKNSSNSILNIFHSNTNNSNVKDEDVRNYIQSLINQKYDLPSIKSIASKKGITVLDQNETRTMEFNPRRAIVKVSKPQCIAPPCYDIIEIISIG